MGDSILSSVVKYSDVLQDSFSSRHNMVPHMPWEQKLEDVLALSKDQLRFTLALFSSVAAGLGLRFIKSPTARHLYCLITGVLLTYYPFGAGVIHALPPALITYLGMRLAPRHCGTIAWLANFPYLIYLHVVNASGHNWMQGIMDFTGCQMVLVLKLVSVAMCHQDFYTKKREEMRPFQASHMLQRPPSLLEFLSYVFSLGNLLAGPYFEFSDYKDFIEHKGVWDPVLQQSKPLPGVLGPSLRCWVEVLVFMLTYLQLLPTFGVQVFKTQWYHAAPLYVKCGIMLVSGITNQLKYAFAWKLSELSLTLAGLNFMGWDEKSTDPQWGRCANVRFFKLITCDSARMVPQYWNIGTGIFLRRYVYERLVPRGKKPGFPQLLATQLTSAIWHGLYPGYLLFFVGTAIWIYFSTLLWKAEEKFAPVTSKALPWRAAKVLWTNFVLNYMATAFMILNARESMKVYGSVYYLPHIIMLAGCFLGPMVVGGKGKKPGTAKAQQLNADAAQAFKSEYKTQ